MFKKMATVLSVAVLAAAASITAQAGVWKQDNVGWWWQNDDGSYPVSKWEWLDGNQDGVAECYYFNADGYMLANTVTPDGYTVDANGAWVVNGTVQVKTTQKDKPNSHTYCKNLMAHSSNHHAYPIGEQRVKDYGSYYEIRTEIYNGTSDGQPELRGVSWVTEYIRIRKDAKVSWGDVSYTKTNCIHTYRDVTVDEYLELSGLQSDKYYGQGIANVVQDEDGYIISFVDGVPIAG